MDSETDMVRQIRALDSDMQTLVYENYNKFISATGDSHRHLTLRSPADLFLLCWGNRQGIPGEKTQILVLP